MGVTLPQELIDEIIDEVAKDPKLRTANLKASSLVSHAWVDRSHKHLFSRKEFGHGEFRDWCSTVRPGEDGPSRHVTRLRYRDEYWDEGTCPFAANSEHIAYFTNVQRLRLIDAGLFSEEYVLAFTPLRSTLRILELEDCQMNINDLLAFLRPFTNLERLSLFGCYDLHDEKLKKRRRLPTLKGRLDLDLAKYGKSRSLLHELSLLPLAFSDIVLHKDTMLEGVVNQVLVASRKTLKVIRVTNCKSPLHRISMISNLDRDSRRPPRGFHRSKGFRHARGTATRCIRHLLYPSHPSDNRLQEIRDHPSCPFGRGSRRVPQPSARLGTS